jgi:hypothetical protein
MMEGLGSIPDLACQDSRSDGHRKASLQLILHYLKISHLVDIYLGTNNRFRENQLDVVLFASLRQPWQMTVVLKGTKPLENA